MATDDRGLDQFDAATPADEAEEHLTNDMFTENQDNDPSATDVSAAADSPDTPETPDTPPTAETPQDVPNEEAEVSEELSDEELFLAALSGDIGSSEGDDDFLITPLRRRQIVNGTIASITDNEILIDVGAKSEGIIAGREFDMLDKEMIESLKVGQELRVFVINPENRHGHPILSLRQAMEEQDWVEAEAFQQSAEVYESSVAGFNKGGLIVRFGKVRGFVPASQVSQDRRRRSTGSTPDERWASMVGEPIKVKVIEVDRGRNRLILSERAADKETRAERRAKRLEQLAAGEVLTGRVVRLTDFGAFVDIEDIDGLIHLSELAWKHVTHPKEVLKVGENVEVEIINIDRERQRVGLSRKRRLPDPWSVLEQELHVGQLVQGKVTKLTNFGAFARLVARPAIEGLIHISELSERRVKHPKEVVQEEEVLTLRIIRIDTKDRRLGLSLKQVDSEEYMDDDWEDMLLIVSEEAEEPAPSNDPVEEVEPEVSAEAVDEVQPKEPGEAVDEAQAEEPAEAVDEAQPEEPAEAVDEAQAEESTEADEEAADEDADETSEE